MKELRQEIQTIIEDAVSPSDREDRLVALFTEYSSKVVYRTKLFTGKSIRASGGFDEDGIPYIAHDNTNGDTPVKSVRLSGRDAWKVYYQQGY